MTLATATEFGKLARAHRLARKWSGRTLAEKTGLAIPTIGTIEGSPYRVIGIDRAVIVADVFELAGDERAEFLDAHARTPLSPFSEVRAEHYDKRNKMRSKIRNFDRMKYATCELALRFIQESTPGEACRCDFGGGSYGDASRACELCFALETVGILGGLGDQERTLARLAAIMDKIAPKVFAGRKASEQ